MRNGIDVDVNEDDCCAGGAKGISKANAVLDDLLGGVGREVAGDDAVFKVDEDECGGLRREFERRHGCLDAWCGDV